ncbi:MAG TPA: flagellar motor protein MotB [Firmicutes bacterium]|nr:flagellar motor protein MotB [Bacillota bacterium]HOQ23568.1 flagellar motor protein MotB [Bacillota bacterium]HPT67259.1 flagellar motor protein MotB [Bacillota bacterium]
MPRRKREDPPGPSSPLWCLSYGDMVTNVLVFFVLLFAFSEIDKSKYEQIANSLRGALTGKSGVLQGGSVVMQEKGGEQYPAVIEDEFRGVMEKINEELSREGENIGGVEVYLEERGLVISFKEKFFFDIGKADLRPAAVEALLRVGKTLKEDNHQIRVEGHTCDLPINTPQYPSNWELSTARAINVVRFLIERVKLEPARLSVSGYGPYRPIVPNINETNRARNRRVDIVLLYHDEDE